MPRPVSTCPSQRQIVCVLLALTLTLSVTTAGPNNKRQYFIACSGWGPSCSMHMSGGLDTVPVVSISRPAPRREPPPPPMYLSRNRGGSHSGIPSLVTSGGWEPGTMGKRKSKSEFSRHLLDILISADRQLHHVN
ncbi:hypothetical protein Bpfe_012993 [Biomphalaria pfeifferi]|uniref:Uncharacterized protein n=1 Tax=Biomphalaria pfeifferi TaxID=112525 RepID=A0AAD8BMU8_BIOPF|nr:hypothetical protein Bpfe_012993 [Biomphalaria pfeifferi]